MKKVSIHIIAIITLLSGLNININAQTSNDSLMAHTRYLKKSHDQKVVSIVFVSVGTAMAVTGIALAAASFKGFFDPDVPHNDYGSAPDILGIGGSALIVAAVPFALASQANKKKAKLYMKKESIMITPGKTASQLVSIGIKISL
jgi:NADH:ubiquinone oxidoreductase subunit K